MSLEMKRTAFIADQLDELTVFALLDYDFSIALHPCDSGLRLTASSLDVDDDDFVMTYGGERWTDDDPGLESDADSSTGTPWAPLIPDHVKDIDSSDEDACADQFIATEDAHAELVELFTALVTSGWKVAVRHVDSKDATTGTPHIRLEAEAPGSDADRAATALRALRLPADFSQLEATYAPEDVRDGPARWRFADNSAVAITASGERHPVKINAVQTYAVSAAPMWTLHPGTDTAIQRHTAGSAMKGSALIQPPSPPTPTQAETDECRKAVDTWASNNEFGPTIEPAKPADVQRALDKLDQGTVGYYLLEFTNGDCYLGQSISIADRLKGHRTLHKDISSIRLLPDPAARSLVNPLRHLLDREAGLIHSLQTARLPARNKAQMTYLTGDGLPIDEIFKSNGTTAADWLSDPIACNRCDGEAGRALTPSTDQLAAGEAAYKRWLDRTAEHADTVRSLLRTYMARCLPLPLHTEYVHWVLSSPQVVPRHRTLSNLSIGWTEAFRTMIGKDGHLSGMLHVNGIELLGEDMSDDALVRFMRQHPGVSVTQSAYQAAGPFNLMLWAPDLESVADLLDDTAVTRAAATAALHLMRKASPGKIRESHNPVLVNAILGIKR
ncbi:GIY-YIG nuclease family protein [Gordonia sp. UCD-TK1]|uniref:GIY-YIG nuclease family protein n=1 Tax=Gordonia sp. UCD-TK1 TaxID=1857893 RepID=UPI00080E93E7|nr:GIY-YIG nuclease family protein [Gordonia sp. UCD-TK1]OCH81141.1 hypothetical protein A9310_18885 [Gordonia sp. UCD-TK1]